ncbi:MAG TPA: ATP synthase F1 subunit delta [candidate division Zixibacteria bacterium]|nr:ATP synthase F1 subunit delta [candidate division Zixibacteria bacterium]
MLAQEVAKKYANGLFLSVKGKKKVDLAYEQLQQLSELIEKDPTILHFLVAPHVLDENKLALLRDVFTGRLDPLFVELMILLVEKHRAGFLHEIIDEFVRLVEAEKGIARCTVITAVAIDNDERQKLNEKLVARTDLKVILEEKVDPAILGGMIVILHNEIIDGSVRRGLDLIGEQLAKVRVH